MQSVALERKLSKYRKHMCVTDRHDMSLAVKVAINPNITNQPSKNVSFQSQERFLTTCNRISKLCPKGQREKLLVTSNFSLFHSVFKRLVLQTRETRTCLERVNPFPNKLWFLRVCSMNLLKTLREKEKLLVTSNFSFSHSVF